MNKLKIKGVYKHFKGDLYIVEDVCKDCETTEDVVLYRALYGDGDLWSRKKDDFLSEVDHEKYPDCLQKYRFELYKVEKINKG